MKSGPIRWPFWIAGISVLAWASLPSYSAATPVSLALKVLDAHGQPVPRFEVMLHSHQHGYVRWQTGTNGAIDFRSQGVDTLRTGDDPYVQAVVRAPDLAPAILHLENKGSRMRETVRLTPGRLVELSVRTADGEPLPETVMPLVVYVDFAWRVRMMRQPQNIRPGRTFDFEMSKLRRMDDGRFQFRVPDEPPPCLLAIHEPGFIRSLESKIIDANDLADNRIDWQLPAPGRLRIRFDLPDGADRPAYSLSRAQVASCIPEVGKYYTVWLKEYESLRFDAALDDLAPGRHMARVLLVPPGRRSARDEGEPNVRVFSDTVDFEVAASEEKTLAFEYAPFDPDGWRGGAAATVTVRYYGGQPAAGETFTLSYIVPHYGGVTVMADKLDTEGRFQLEDVRAGPNGPEFFLRVGDRWSHRMQMTETGDQTFEFTLAPQPGDRCPDVALTDLATGRRVSLDALRGTVVYLEFWATWCGPCKVPMARLNEAAKERQSAWAGRVHVLAASIDDSPEIVRAHVKQRGWTHVRHLWAGDGSKRAFESKAAEAFGLHGVPTAMLIDADGRIVWRGHPKDADCEAQIDELLQRTGAGAKEARDQQ